MLIKHLSFSFCSVKSNLKPFHYFELCDMIQRSEKSMNLYDLECQACLQDRLIEIDSRMNKLWLAFSKRRDWLKAVSDYFFLNLTSIELKEPILWP